jgi:hypothetical protein
VGDGSSSLVKLATGEKQSFRGLLNATDVELVLSARDYISASVRGCCIWSCSLLKQVN